MKRNNFRSKAQKIFMGHIRELMNPVSGKRVNEECSSVGIKNFWLNI